MQTALPINTKATSVLTGRTYTKRTAHKRNALWTDGKHAKHDLLLNDALLQNRKLWVLSSAN